MHATYHQPFATPGPLYPWKIEEIGIGLEGAGKFTVFNVLSHKSLGNFDTYELAETAATEEAARVAQIAEQNEIGG